MPVDRWARRAFKRSHRGRLTRYMVRRFGRDAITKTGNLKRSKLRQVAQEGGRHARQAQAVLNINKGRRS